MNPTIILYTILVILSNSSLERVQAQVAHGDTSWNVKESMEALNKVVENLQAKIIEFQTLLNNLLTKKELEAILLNNLVTKSELLMHATSLSNLEAQSKLHATLLNNMMATGEFPVTSSNVFKAKVDMQGDMLISLEAKVNNQSTLLNDLSINGEMQLTALRNLEAQSKVQGTLLQKLEANADAQATSLSNVVTKEVVEAIVAQNDQNTNTSTVEHEAEKSAGNNHNSSTNEGIVEGVIVSTSRGVVVIPLDSREPRTISSADVDAYGVAYDWQTRKVYWIEYRIAIKRSNLDGSSVELLISDTSYLFGLAVDQITGNFYYGVREPNARITACDRSGKKCVIVASGSNIVGSSIWDIALFPAEGSIFWSDTNNRSVTRANMDGTNATVIIMEDIYGLYPDAVSQRLYWTSLNGLTIGHRDLNGNNSNILLNAPFRPLSIAVHRGTLYLGAQYPSGAYSITQGSKVFSIANTPGYVFHITLYGRDKVPSRPNPCNNSVCSNLCVLSGASFTCL